METGIFLTTDYTHHTDGEGIFNHRGTEITKRRV
ncbi:hypothetical protein SBV1_1240019 [Verrucomicrobia bacterium]|nr:hypothetical protein SBV1_1240019 [Verrucomicrobiota bacterium]